MRAARFDGWFWPRGRGFGAQYNSDRRSESYRIVVKIDSSENFKTVNNRYRIKPCKMFQLLGSQIS